MIKLKDLYPNQPSFIGVEEPVKEEFIGEAKIIPTKKIDSKTWRDIKYDLRDQVDEVIKVGEDYAVFQAPKFVIKTLKQVRNLLGKL
jgi:hypothetical protein